MKEWFNYKWLNSNTERTYGIILRLFGIDFTVMVLGWLSDWVLIDVRIPVNYGVYAQSLGLLLSIARLPTATFEVE